MLHGKCVTFTRFWWIDPRKILETSVKSVDVLCSLSLNQDIDLIDLIDIGPFAI